MDFERFLALPYYRYMALVNHKLGRRRGETPAQQVSAAHHARDRARFLAAKRDAARSGG